MVAIGVLLYLLVESPYLLSVASFAGIYALLVTGLTLFMGFAGQISVGHAAYFALGAYTSGILTAKYGVHPLVAFPPALVLTCATAFLVGAPTLRLRGHYLAMATIGFGEIVFIFFNESFELAGGPSGLAGIPRLRAFEVQLVSEKAHFLLIWSVVVLGVVVALNVTYSSVGRALKAVRGSEVAARAMGIDTARFKILVFVMSAAYAATAGTLYAHYMTFLSPSAFAVNTSILFLAMVVVGGMRSVWGGVVGGVVMTVLPELVRTFGDFDILFYGAVLVLIMVFLPQGIAGSIEGRFQRRWSRQAPATSKG